MYFNWFAVGLFLVCTGTNSLDLVAHFSEAGLKGTVTITNGNQADNVTISTDLIGSSEAWSWTVRQFPVDYTLLEERCSDKQLGSVVVELDSLVGPAPVNGSAELQALGDLLQLTGQTGLWGRSMLLVSAGGLRTCATLMAIGGGLKVGEARLRGSIMGSVFLEWVGSSESSDALIYTNLVHNSPGKRTPNTLHNWKIFTTDVLESEADKSRVDCNSLQVVFEPGGRGTGGGELGARLGSVTVGTRQLYRHPTLILPDFANRHRHLFLVLFHNRHTDSYAACARINLLTPTVLKAYIQSKGLSGLVTLEQASPFSPTSVSLNWTWVNKSPENLGGFRIHDLPPQPPVGRGQILDPCSLIGNVYNPTSRPLGADALLPGAETQDKYAVGDLSGKVGYTLVQSWDVFLPLRGQFSVAHRSFVIYRNGDVGEEPWICSELARYSSNDSDTKVAISTAEVVFRYPLAGRVLMRQPLGQPESDTAILIESLVHSDGTSQNDTHDHRWNIHVNPPGKDFYNWSERCISAGPAYDPYQLYPSNRSDGLWSVHGYVSIAGAKVRSGSVSRHLFTDTNTALSGAHSILGRSFLIFDDHGPKARGERLACSKITSVYRRKAVARDWYGNGETVAVSGRIEMFQQTEYDMTDVEINMQGVANIGQYHIHMTPVLGDLEFPCEETTIYGEYNPYNVANSPLHGTPDQYKVGDLSGKHGDGHDHITLQAVAYNDSTLQLFGQQSVLGRAVVLLQKQSNIRLACATLERGYAPTEARELRAIASFHHPLGFAYGYIRMTQLIHTDNSRSDTVIEVNLRHPGLMDRNITRNHNWAIFVNPVGVDASVKVLNTRCTAAGYIWNPYYTQLADPLNDELYRRECGPDHPLRCYVGDISARLGTIDLGDKRAVFTDPNFPLEGDVSALGKSIVIMTPERGRDKFACANIEPDKDTIKYVNLRRPPKFIVSQFLDDVRGVMGIPDWFLTVDNRYTKTLHNGGCIQLLLHFKGPSAIELEQDFSQLLSTGRLGAPSLFIPGYIHPTKRKSTINHKLCSTREPTDKGFQVLSLNGQPSLIAVSSTTFTLVGIIIWL